MNLHDLSLRRLDNLLWNGLPNCAGARFTRKRSLDINKPLNKSCINKSCYVLLYSSGKDHEALMESSMGR